MQKQMEIAGSEVWSVRGMAGQKFHEDEEVKNEATAWLCAQAAEFYDIGIQNLVPRLKCRDKGGDYVEK
jgi:elongation factor P hydroxylase